MQIVTSGYRYLDIDAYASILAYAELSRVLGRPSQAVSSGKINESVTPTIRSWPANLQTSYTPDPADTFVLIDISEPEFFEKFVDLERIDAVLDHHPGFVEYWQQRIGERSQIMPIGAACTLVYEQWESAGVVDKMRPETARSLASGILDNTLNFRAEITTPRDHSAYAALAGQGGLDDSWPQQYFSECQTAILADIQATIDGDFKNLQYSSFAPQIAVAQLVVWDAAAVLDQCKDQISQQLASKQPHWFMNLACIGDGHSYFLCGNNEVQAWLSQLLGITFDGDIAVAPRLWLRKEIMTADAVAKLAS